ncbi:MAG TPA: hypothetical protein VHE53_00720 [Patescibacteria group bacterium]|nr:hypothetical protein [Patescibacteria group bacterium]
MSYTERHIGDAIREGFDTSGRNIIAKLQENRSFVPNRLPGRIGHPTDTVAFSEFQQSNDEAISLIKYIRSTYSETPLTPKQLEEFAYAIHAMPMYLRMRANNPVDILPPYFIDASRAADGIKAVAYEMVRDPKLSDKPKTQRQTYNFADGNNTAKKNHFIADNKNPKSNSCPAPQVLVEEVLKAMIYPPKEAIDPKNEAWGEYVPDEEEARRIIRFGLGFLHNVDATDKRDKVNPNSSRSVKLLLEASRDREISWREMDTALGR